VDGDKVGLRLGDRDGVDDTTGGVDGDEVGLGFGDAEGVDDTAGGLDGGVVTGCGLLGSLGTSVMEKNMARMSSSSPNISSGICPAV